MVPVLTPGKNWEPVSLRWEPVTPKPQKAFSGKILCRDKKAQALWNKMGFPNAGADALATTLGKFQKNGTPVFINIGKNRWTENHRAFDDYLSCIQKLHSYADAFVINLSSPNTQGLRDLLEASRLKNFLSSLKNQMPGEATHKPLLLKLSPDCDKDSLKGILEVSLNFVQGWILTNSTKKTYPSSPFPSQQGGITGKPLAELSRKALKIAASYKTQNPEKLLISTGGIGDDSEILKRLRMGADLVQFYSALVFSGPWFFKHQIKKLRSIGKSEP